MRYCTDTQRAAANVPVQNVEDILAAVPEGAALVCVELVVGATPLSEFEHPLNAFYVFGPEDGSVPQAIVDAADAVVYVPTIGCLNLAASVNVVLYDRTSKLGLPDDANDRDDLIRRSRDNRNRLRLK
jgi:tRNA(Leu) C34 or U34 (ribose-2'-O)-methylase TrmL